MNKYFNFFILCTLFSCLTACSQQQAFTGTFSNGYKGNTLRFMLSADKKTIKELTFNGHWNCGGKLESMLAGPEKAIPVKNGEIHAVVLDPEGGGSTAFRFQIDGKITGKTASGTFRMSLTGLGCDTYLLKWTAQAK